MTDQNGATTSLTEAERAAIFAANAPVDRNQKRRSGVSPIPPKAVAWALVAFAVLGLGGEAIEHYVGGYGAGTATPGKYLPSNANLTPLSALNSLSTDEFMGLKEIDNATAPSFTLRTQNNHVWKLRRNGGKVIVLTFENAICNDICPVVSEEVEQAQVLLGNDASHVEFAFVNTDPRQHAVNARPAALTKTGLASRPNVVFLTGSLRALDAVWTDYGLKIKVGSKAAEVSHNNVMYFISPRSQLEALATPFAQAIKDGAFTLRANYVARFAKGIATTADSLVK
jgi:cytochrome oxidase Cu insertion factor (SCO1/SenC/PrrC family)